MGVNSLPKTVTRQRRGCDLNPGPTAPESSTQPVGYRATVWAPVHNRAQLTRVLSSAPSVTTSHRCMHIARFNRDDIYRVGQKWGHRY